MEVPRIAVSVDLVILTVRGGQLAALVWRRDTGPHLGCWALPGGFIRLDEDLPAAAARVLAERAGLPDAPAHLEQLRTYGYPDRDPRQRVVSVAYLGLAPDLPAPEQPRMSWQPIAGLAGMAFDHVTILRDGVERARAKLEYTSLAAAFCRDEFTVAELRRVYEIVWGTRLDPRNFHRKVTGAEQFLVETGAASSSGGRPAQLYRRGPAALLHPPMLRPRQRAVPGVAGPDAPESVRQRWPSGEPDRYISVIAEAEDGQPGWQPDQPGGRISPAQEDNDVRADSTIPADS